MNNNARKNNGSIGNGEIGFGSTGDPEVVLQKGTHHPTRKEWFSKSTIEVAVVNVCDFKTHPFFSKNIFTAI